MGRRSRAKRADARGPSGAAPAPKPGPRAGGGGRRRVIVAAVTLLAAGGAAALFFRGARAPLEPTPAPVEAVEDEALPPLLEPSAIPLEEPATSEGRETLARARVAHS